MKKEDNCVGMALNNGIIVVSKLFSGLAVKAIRNEEGKIELEVIEKSIMERYDNKTNNAEIRKYANKIAIFWSVLLYLGILFNLCGNIGFLGLFATCYYIAMTCTEMYGFIYIFIFTKKKDKDSIQYKTLLKKVYALYAENKEPTLKNLKRNFGVRNYEAKNIKNIFKIIYYTILTSIIILNTIFPFYITMPIFVFAILVALLEMKRNYKDFRIFDILFNRRPTKEQYEVGLRLLEYFKENEAVIYKDKSNPSENVSIESRKP